MQEFNKNNLLFLFQPTMDNIYIYIYYLNNKHTTDTHYIVKTIQTTFYQQEPHTYFNLIKFNEILTTFELPEDDKNVSKHVGVIII